MSLRPEQRKSALALSAYLKTVHPAVMLAALADLGYPLPEEAPATSVPRICQTCGRIYPVCRRLWADDHEFVPPPPRPQAEGTD